MQYPGVDAAIKADLDNVDFFSSMSAVLFPGVDVGPVIDEIRLRISEELDYRIEASNQQLFYDFFKAHPFIRIPRVLHELSSERVRTTELHTGARFQELDSWSQEERDYLFHGGGVVTFLDFGLVKRFTADEMDSRLRPVGCEPCNDEKHALTAHSSTLAYGNQIAHVSFIAESCGRLSAWYAGPTGIKRARFVVVRSIVPSPRRRAGECGGRWRERAVR